MAKEYIERNALIAEYDRVHVGPPGGARKLIEEAPTADVAEVKHGEWIPVTDRLPKGRKEYLCICVFGASEMQFYNVLMFHPEENAENGYVTGPHFSNEGMNDMRVTHWMKLPKPPCGAKMDGGKGG